MAEFNHSHHTNTNTSKNDDPSDAIMSIDGSEQDTILSKSQFLTREEVLRRRSRRIKQLARCYRDNYWALMEELKNKYREYYWKYGKSPYKEDEDREANGVGTNGEDHCNNINNSKSGVVLGDNANRCAVAGCKSKAMALSRFCHPHILSDSKQKLYKACTYVIKRLRHHPTQNRGAGKGIQGGLHRWRTINIKRPRFLVFLDTKISAPSGPIYCGKPILKSTVPALCPPHFQKAEKHVTRALKKAGLNVSSSTKLAPKFHVIVAEYVSQIQTKRRASQKGTVAEVQIKLEEAKVQIKQEEARVQIKQEYTT